MVEKIWKGRCARAVAGDGEGQVRVKGGQGRFAVGHGWRIGLRAVEGRTSVRIEFAARKDGRTAISMGSKELYGSSGEVSEA